MLTFLANLTMCFLGYAQLEMETYKMNEGPTTESTQWQQK